MNYELHAEPDGAPAGYAETLREAAHHIRRHRARCRHRSQAFTGGTGKTPATPVTVTLKSAGFYSMSHEFRKDQPVKNKVFQ